MLEFVVEFVETGVVELGGDAFRVDDLARQAALRARVLRLPPPLLPLLRPAHRARP